MDREHKKGKFQNPFLWIGNIKTGVEVGRRNKSKVGVVVLLLADSRAIPLTVCLYRTSVILKQVCRTSSSPAPLLVLRLVILDGEMGIETSVVLFGLVGKQS